MKKTQIPFLDYVRLAGLLYAERTNQMNTTEHGFWYGVLHDLLSQYFPDKWKRGSTVTMKDLANLEVVNVH